MPVTLTRLPPQFIAPNPTETPWTLDVLGPPAVAFAVHGTPGAQGSKNAIPVTAKGPNGTRVFTGKTRVVESSKKVKPWRKVVADVTQVAVLAQRRGVPLRGAVVADMVFTLKKPQRFAKGNPTDLRWLHGKPTSKADGDLEKLLRANSDALTTGGAWADDSQLTDYRVVGAWYVGSCAPDVLRVPGAVIRLWEVPQAIIDTHVRASLTVVP